MRRNLISDLFVEVMRFVEKSGFTPFILGTGDMMPFRGFTVGTPLRNPGWLPAPSFHIPYRTLLGDVSALQAISPPLDSFQDQAPIALIVLEGIGSKDFPSPFTECGNHVAWYYYEPGEAQYLTLCRGEHSMFAYPAGYKVESVLTRGTRMPCRLRMDTRTSSSAEALFFSGRPERRFFGDSARPGPGRGDLHQRRIR